MSPSPLPSPITATPVGLVIARDLTFEEWREAGAGIGTAMRSAAFCIGDWLIYGQDKWGKQLPLDESIGLDAPRGRITREAYDAAVELTGLDRTTLAAYASVCRSIPLHLRNPRISFEHHKAILGAPIEVRPEWIELVATQEPVPPVRRVRASVRMSRERPRIAEPTEILTREPGAGHENYIPHLARLLTVLRKTLPGMDEDQRAALKEDAAPLLQLLQSL